VSRKPDKKRKRSKGNAPHRATGGAERRRSQKTQLLVDAAQVAWQRHQYGRTLALYTEALRREPKNVKFAVDLARAHGLRRNFDTAEALLDRAVRAAPKRAAVHCMLARSYFMFSWLEKAAACYCRALELNPNPDEKRKTHLALAGIHERLHRLDDARTAVGEALTADPDDPRAKLLLTVLDRRAGDWPQAAAGLRALLAAPVAAADVRGDAWYELGRVLDHEGDYDGAMDALLHAKAARRQRVAGELDEARQVAIRNERMLASLTPEHFQRWHREGARGTPLRATLLTSHPRSGTTLLEQILDSHPDVISADEHMVMAEEVFGALGRATASGADVSIPEMLDRASPEDIDAVRQAYWEHSQAVVRESIGTRMLLDKNPELTMLIPVVNRVFPEMRIVFPLRDPRDVVLSCFMQPLPVNSVSVNYFSLQTTAEKYAMTMRTWLAIRPLTAAPWLEVHYEKTVADLPVQARRLLDFLDLPWHPGVLQFHQHAREKHVRSPTYEAVTTPIHSRAIGRWQNYAKYLDPVMETLEPFVKEFGYT
jgi:tetratricopeptide (TPR) repeat protein